MREVRIAGAADSRQVHALRLRQLDRERPDTAGRAVDQNALSRLHLAGAQTDKGRVGGKRNSGGLLKGETGWHRGHQFLRGRDILRDSRTGLTEDVVARPAPGHAFRPPIPRCRRSRYPES